MSVIYHSVSYPRRVSYGAYGATLLKRKDVTDVTLHDHFASQIYQVQLPEGGGHDPMSCRRMMTCPRWCELWLATWTKASRTV